MAIFQVVLAAGVPLGHAAWGGADAHLSSALRIGSALSAVFYVWAAAVVLRRAGHEVRWVSAKLARRGTWMLVVIFSVATIANFLSQSAWERFLLGPTALVLTVLCAVVARAPAEQRPGADIGSAPAQQLSGPHQA
jgi:hypothetical protein